MSPTLYRNTVIAGALTWAMFGLSIGMVLANIDAGQPYSRLELGLAALSFLMGVGDVWWLFRFGMARPTKGYDATESVV